MRLVRRLVPRGRAALVEGADGRVLFERDADRALVPASNAKIFTTLAAMAAFGPTHRFETRLLSESRPDAAGSIDSLVVQGGGDPAVNNEDWWQIAVALQRSGLRRVRGDLVLDDSLFDRERWHPSWGRTGSRAYHAPVGALTANYGAFSVSLRPAREAGAAVEVSLLPPVSHLIVVNQALTGPAGSQTRLRVDREARPRGEAVVVRGMLAADEPVVRFHRSVLDPARYAGSVLRWQLERQGIQVDGAVRVGEVADATEVLLKHAGRPLSEIVQLCMKYSNNQIAEALVKQLGAQVSGRGGWRAGMTELRRVLIELGVPEKGFSLVDGSGLSVRDKATPRGIVEALRVGERSFSFGPEWVASMPLANLDGTLAERAVGAAGAVRAKTGTLDRVTALSGYVRLSTGEWGRFSILVNGYRGSDAAAIGAVDDFVAALTTTPVPASERPLP